MKRTANPRKVKRRQQTSQQLLLLTKELQNLAKTLRRPLPASPANGPLQDPNETDILSELYSGSYFPKSHISIKDDALGKKAHKMQKALCATFSPEQEKLFFQYEAAENMHGFKLSERAYKDGFRLAIQLIWAGRLESAASK